MHKVLRISIVLALLAAVPQDATASQIDATYEARLAGLKVGDVRLRATVAGTAYAIRAEGSYGLPGFREGFDASAVGRIENGRPMPAAYSLRTGDGPRSSVSISYADGRYAAARIVTAQPSRTDVIAILDEHRIGTLDPLSALMHLVMEPGGAAACSRSAAVFTGQARLDISLSEPARQPGPPVCGATYRLIAGHRRDARPVTDIRIHLPKDTGAAPRLPDRVVMTTSLGQLVIARTGSEVAGATTARK